MKIIFLILLVFVHPLLNAQSVSDDTKFYKKFYRKTKGKIPPHVEFTQDNEHYKNGNIIGTSVWFEEIKYPNYFKIRFGRSHENYIIFQNDSSFRYEFGMQKEAKYAPNRLLFMLGGFSFYSFKESKNKIHSFGIDLKKSYSTELNGKKVRVIGANPKDFTQNQWWIDEKTFEIVRIIEEAYPKVMMTFDFKKYETLENRYKIESEVWVYQNDELVQKEFYKDIKVIQSLQK